MLYYILRRNDKKIFSGYMPREIDINHIMSKYGSSPEMEYEVSYVCFNGSGDLTLGRFRFSNVKEIIDEGQLTVPIKDLDELVGKSLKENGNVKLVNAILKKI